MHQKCNISATAWFSESFTTNFSPEIHTKKAQQVLSYKNLIKDNKTANNEGIVFFYSPCSTLIMIPIDFWRNSDPCKKRTFFQLENGRRQAIFKQITKIFVRKLLKHKIKIYESLLSSWWLVFIQKQIDSCLFSLFYNLGLKYHLLLLQSPVCPPPSRPALHLKISEPPPPI